MKIEIETRFLDINKEELIKKLRSLGAQDLGEEKLDDIIFYDQDLKWVKENRLVRLRKRGDVSTMVYKSNQAQVIDSAKEVELVINDFSEAKIFLESIGLTAYRIAEKYRHTFKLDNVTLDIDTWPKIPPYVEFEGESVEDLKKVATKLGFDWNDKFDGDPKYVFKKYGIDISDLRAITF